MIEPRTLKGFRDYPPELMLPREALIDTARKVFRSYGYPPIDTPALEYTEILLGKMDAGAEIQRQIYRFKDHGDRDVALRFDLTVPFARFAAQYVGKLGTPFKRYHIGPVWRGENTQKGRYREFYQCDFDIIGTTANAADAEIALVIHDLVSALGFDRFTIRVNNRTILNGLLGGLGLADKATDILRSLDKLAKQGPDVVRGEFTTAELSEGQATQVLNLAAARGSNAEVLDRVANEFGTHVAAGVAQLRGLLDICGRAGVPGERLVVDLGICRGLDYYTGTIFETFLGDLPGIGSICSGGRYDDLAGLYTKQKLPGVGASLGLDRLLAAMEELKLLPKTGTPADVLIVQSDAALVGDYQRIARELRAAGLGVELYPDAKKPGVQLQYAESKGYPLAILAGADELKQNVVKLRTLATRSEVVTPLAGLADAVRAVAVKR
ncbi:MAG: histidine--tRNA ligase [Gemmataceae bacterium]|nr:histidine--tRNA ligase [Gemmataceae bacterium]